MQPRCYPAQVRPFRVPRVHVEEARATDVKEVSTGVARGGVFARTAYICLLVKLRADCLPPMYRLVRPSLFPTPPSGICAAPRTASWARLADRRCSGSAESTVPDLENRHPRIHRYQTVPAHRLLRRRGTLAARIRMPSRGRTPVSSVYPLEAPAYPDLASLPLGRPPSGLYAGRRSPLPSKLPLHALARSSGGCVWPFHFDGRKLCKTNTSPRG